MGANGFLRRAIAEDRVPSLILWGPPGVGKTTLARLIAAQTASALRVVLGRRHGRQGDAGSPRRGAAAARPHEAAHDPLPGRDPPVQPRPAGRLSALHGNGGDRPDRRHDGKPVVRAERRPAVALQGRGPGPFEARGRSPASSGARCGTSSAGSARATSGWTTRRSPSSRRHRGETRAGRSISSSPPPPTPRRARRSGSRSRACGSSSRGRSSSTTRRARSTTT